MTDKNAAIILAVEARRLPATFREGDTFHPMSTTDTICTLENAGTWLGPRGSLEDNENFRQIIPYVIIRQNGKIVTYIRGASGGEARLHGKLSVGLGGHIDLPDIKTFYDRPEVDLKATLEQASERELEEEVDLYGVMRGDIEWVGLLTVNATEVDRVHIGVVGILDVTPIGTNTVEALEDSQESLCLMTVAELTEATSRLENWTRIALPYLATNDAGK